MKGNCLDLQLGCLNIIRLKRIFHKMWASSAPKPNLTDEFIDAVNGEPSPPGGDTGPG